MIPDNISSALIAILKQGERASVVFKTGLKPSHNSPILWLALTNQRVILFSSRHGGTVFRAVEHHEVNAVFTENGCKIIKLLFWDTTIPDIAFSVAADVDPVVVKDFADQLSPRISNTPPAT